MQAPQSAVTLHVISTLVGSWGPVECSGILRIAQNFALRRSALFVVFHKQGFRDAVTPVSAFPNPVEPSPLRQRRGFLLGLGNGAIAIGALNIKAEAEKAGGRDAAGFC
jgi:hypothetical protein